MRTIIARDATQAAIHLRRQLLMEKSDCELVGVIKGEAHFDLVDCTGIALAPYCAAMDD